MQTSFTLAQLANPDIAEADKILRACVHCGFCTATCPTYVLLGDELDSPRGRIYLIKDMLEQDRAASEVEVKHIDLPQDMQRAMAKQAEAERERRAKVINADGEFQAAAKLAEAAQVLMQYPVSIQLRYLQTMREIASERNTTTFFPLPMDLLGPMFANLKDGARDGR